MATLKESLTYNPVELKFGTSGLRGLVTEMTDLECYINIQGFLKFLSDNEGLEKGETVVIAGDLRDSTPRIMRTAAQAISDAGYIVSNQGFIPTPAAAYYAQKLNILCIMVTGSHIPADRNGIKFYKKSGELLKSDETNVINAVASVRDITYSTDSEQSIFSVDGSLRHADELNGPTDDAMTLYKNRYLDFFDNNVLAGQNIVFYQHSAVGRDLLVDILQALGASVQVIGRSDVFVPIDTENITPDDQKYFEDVANEFNHPYAIVSTDGDSDRPFVIDGNGVFYRGDILGALVAKWLSADFCALPISSSDAIDDYLTQDNIPYVHTKIGSPYVIDAMNSAINDGKSKVVGWEVNGGFLIGANITIANKKLEKLPTRDALFPIIVALIAAKDSSIASVFKDLQARYTDAGLIDDFPQEISQKIISTLSVADGTAINLIEKTFIGFGKVKEINSLDGVRIYFDNGEIAHIRPSGNAPQLRIYSIANSPERAKEIVSLAIQEQNGIFRNLQKQLS